MSNEKKSYPTVKSTIVIPGDTGEVSDGYHTFNQLYEHRHALFLTLVQMLVMLGESKVKGWMSEVHNDNTGMLGWFIIGVDIKGSGSLGKTQISYHLPIRLWPVARAIIGIHVMAKAPKWDGHSSDDVISRLYEIIKHFRSWM
jgi:hypothetical protein